ncbi:major surface-labeled trophozoite antigen 417-like [Bolinopsis microptera]|uniref:major surface-labeled trophozoite antigen 417-like n=1 Tax=Bolinopsis microptera TaxID=2820187 RepID=UPI00307AFD51
MGTNLVRTGLLCFLLFGIVHCEEDCIAGQFLDQTNGCTDCPADEWSAAANTATTCTACPTGKEVATGKGTQESDCTWKDCIAGQFLDQTNGCTDCPADEWSAAANTATTCTACPTGKEVATGKGTQESDCTWKDCIAGQFLDQTNGCTDCPADEWSAAANTATTCTACPTGKEVATGKGTQESDCTWKDCIAGQFLDQTNGCTDCPADEWSAAANTATTCTACPTGKEVATGKGTQESDCTWKDCIAGQFLDQTNGCTDCPADEWSAAANTATTCTACPTGKEVATGKGTQESDCTWKDCIAGQFLDQTNGCTDCPADEWSAAANTATTCTACPTGKEVATGKGTKESDCTWSKLFFPKTWRDQRDSS